MSNLNGFEVTMPSDTEVVVTRTFNAPRALVWDAWTKPALISRWLLGPEGWDMPVCEVDLRVGGGYRYEWSQAGRESFGFSGSYVEIKPTERLVSTEMFNGQPPASTNTLILTEKNGRTTSVLTMKYDSKQTRDMVVATGMTDGIASSYDRLERVVHQAA